MIRFFNLLALAGRLDRHPEPHALEGKVLSLLFLSPSLRTLASFQAAMVRLGGGAFVISPDMSIHGLEARPRLSHRWFSAVPGQRIGRSGHWLEADELFSGRRVDLRKRVALSKDD
jgi:hypothetical protein